MDTFEYRKVKRLSSNNEYYVCRKCYKTIPINSEGLCKECYELWLSQRKPIPKQKVYTDDKKSKVTKIFNKEYSRISTKYSLPQIYLKLVDLSTQRHGTFYRNGFNYSNFHPVISININHSLSEIRATIIHELCHAVDYYNFGYSSKPAHHKRFWKLTKEFGLSEKDYYKKTKAMEGVF